MLNKTVMMGRVCADIELKQTQSGIPVASFSIAVQRDNAAKGEKPQTDFFDVVAWRGQAEFIAEHFHKGKGIVVSGRMQTRTWEDKQGSKRKSVELMAEAVYFTLDTPAHAKESSPSGEDDFHCFDEAALSFAATDAEDSLPF